MRIKTVILVIALSFLAGCTTETEYGKCIGLADEKDPALIYKVSTWNVFLAIIGIELIYPPIAVIVDSTFCPVGKKEKQEKS